MLKILDMGKVQVWEACGVLLNELKNFLPLRSKISCATSSKAVPDCWQTITVYGAFALD